MKRSVANRSTRTPFASATSTWLSRVIPVGVDQQQQVVEQDPKERVLEAALDEYCKLRESGESLDASDFCERYPSYRHSLRRLIDVHETLDQFDETDQDVWPLVGTRFLGFDLRHELGVGAFSRVYLATEPALGGRRVAVKIALYGDDEAETLGKLQHPNVVPVHSVQTDPQSGMTAVCMPYLGSATLADVLDVAYENETPPLQAVEILRAVARREQVASAADDELAADPDPLLERGDFVDGVVHLGAQLADALAYTHGQGILHRDLKPSNVLVTPPGCPMLLDFNLSVDIEMEFNRLGGTLPYMPPEQITDVYLRPFDAKRPGDVRSDIFSLGVILYELLTGRLPFGDPPSHVEPVRAGQAYLRAQQDRPQPIEEINPQVDFNTARLVERCLELKPKYRPQDAVTLAAQLRRRLATRQRALRWARRNWLALAGAAAVCSVTGALGGWHLATRPPREVRHYRHGLAAFDKADYEAAVDYFTRAWDANRNYQHARFARGLAYQRLNRLDEATDDLYAVEKESAEPIVQECLAYALLVSGQGSRARLRYEQLAKRFVDDARLQTNLGLSRIYVDSLGYALDHTQKAIELDPRLAVAYQLRAQILDLRISNRGIGSNEHVIADLARARELGADNPLLDYQSARAFAIQAQATPDREAELVAQMRRNLESLAHHVSSRELGQWLLFRRWSDEPWFQDLRSRCTGDYPTQALQRDLLLSVPPNPQAVRGWLEEGLAGCEQDP